MDIINFKEAYKSVVLESTDDAKIKNYIRSIVEEIMAQPRRPIKIDPNSELIKDYNGGDFELYKNPETKYILYYVKPKNIVEVDMWSEEPDDSEVQEVIDNYLDREFPDEYDEED